jgi:flavin reductase
MTALRQQFLDAMSRVAASVTIVTTDGPSGPFGMTVSAMSSVSADAVRPVLLVCINRNASGAGAILANRVFGVSILRAEQVGLADIFAGRDRTASGPGKFSHGRWARSATGAPLLDEALVSFDCRLDREMMVGEHHVLLGAVQAVRIGPSEDGLVYVDRAYARVERLAVARASGA